MQVPPHIAESARARIRESAATEQRGRVAQATASGDPTAAELDPARKVSRIQAVTGVTTEAARAIIANVPPAQMGLAGERRLGAERIQGKTADFVGVSFLDLARAAARTVGRVAFKDLRPQGSGFMISPVLFLTNNHVIESAAAAAQFVVEFEYELGVDGRPKPVSRFELDPNTFFYTNPENDLDFTIVALGRRISGAADLPNLGFCPLLNTDDKHVLGEFVNLVQHPEGDFKQVVLRENQLVSRVGRVLHYVADTQPGSSGSPVFNDQWEVVALHHWGEPFTEQNRNTDVNEGIRVSCIFEKLQEDSPRLTQSERELLQQALTFRSRRPSTVGDEAATTVVVSNTNPTTNVRPEPPRADPARPDPARPPAALELSATGPHTWTIPLHVHLRVGDRDGQPPAPGTPAATLASALAERITIDRRYSNRNGYNPAFLPGHRVELPDFADEALAELAARRLDARPDQNPFELKYQHFSVVMNAQRRMAFFTAGNIDGSTWININRDTGLPREAAEATEVWFDDPRIDADAQCDQSLYDAQRPRRIFDRGHLVRRQDPAWGTPARATRANADTFHFTNCSPQASTFNQQSRFWQGIENYVLDNARAQRERVTVITGPVFQDNDRPYRYVKVPALFFKILARVEDDQLLATALLADQSELIPLMPERFAESFDDLGNVAEYQTSVREVERLTGLDFGPLRNHDTFRAGPEAVGNRRPLRSLEDVSLDRNNQKPNAAEKIRRRGRGRKGSV